MLTCVDFTPSFTFQVYLFYLIYLFPFTLLLYLGTVNPFLFRQQVFPFFLSHCWAQAMHKSPSLRPGIVLVMYLNLLKTKVTHSWNCFIAFIFKFSLYLSLRQCVTIFMLNANIYPYSCNLSNLCFELFGINCIGWILNISFHFVDGLILTCSPLLFLSLFFFFYSVTVDEQGILIFDTGPGMDGSDENSIVKWYVISVFLLNCVFETCA